jgi:hypothetical protein
VEQRQNVFVLTKGIYLLGDFNNFLPALPENEFTILPQLKKIKKCLEPLQLALCGCRHMSPYFLPLTIPAQQKLKEELNRLDHVGRRLPGQR